MTVVVVGAGPAGVSAALWLRRYGIDHLWVDGAGSVGGMLFDVHNPIDDYPGVNAGDGRELAGVFASWIHTGPVRRLVTEIGLADDGTKPVVQFDDGEVVAARAVILCTGTRKRRLGIPGEQESLGRCVRQSAARDAHLFRDRLVAVVGGGDSALEGCLRLSEAGVRQVLLVARSPLRARGDFRERVARLDNVKLLPIGRTITEIAPTGAGCSITFDDGTSRIVAAVFVRIGVEPTLPLLPTGIGRDPNGFVLVDERKRTTLSAIFAAGDVTSTPLRSIATSVADGAVAARAVAEFLEFS